MDRLINAAADEFKRSGFAGATTAAIARNAEVSEAQLFRYFGSKTDLFREAIFKPLNEHFFEFNAKHLAAVAGPGDIGHRRRLYITELQRFIGEHSKMLMSLLVAETYAPGSTQGVGGIDSLQTYFGRGAAMMSGRIDKDPKVDPRLMVRVSFAAVLGCVMFKDLIFPPGLASDDEISAAIIDFLIDGISANSVPGPRGPDNIR
jgi:AcrR family transcriptional regulator